MQEAKQHIVALQEEFNGIEEAEVEVEVIMKHLNALEGILKGVKKLVLCATARNMQEWRTHHCVMLHCVDVNVGWGCCE